MLRRRRLLPVALAVTLVASLVGAAPIGVAGAQSGDWIDTADRAAVVGAYEAEFTRVTPSMDWTGDRSSCVPGTTAQAYRDATVDRVNYYRRMAGVPGGVVENRSWSASAQESALSMSVSGRLSHDPDSSFGCFNATVEDAAGRSNLYLGRTGPDAITGYMEDPGASNASVGHRSWIYHATLTQIGIGDLPSDGNWAANTLQVIDPETAFGPQPAQREAEGFVAWPVRGYNPGPLVFPRWSFTLRGATFESAEVRVSRDGVALPSTVIHRSTESNGAPLPNVVWEPQGVDTDPETDQTYVVEVSNVSVGAQKRSYRYEVIVLGVRPPAGTVVAAVDLPVASAAIGATSTPAGRIAGEPSARSYEDFVGKAYRDFLGREPDPAEVAEWSARLAEGTGRSAFVAELAASPEWTSNVVGELYLDTLGRPGDRAGIRYWAHQLGRGVPLATVAAAFYGSPEYVAGTGGTPEGWVAELYGVLLDRTIDDAGLDYWVRETTGVGSHQVAHAFYQATESRRARVAALYRRLLDREPDADGLTYWSDVLASGNDLALAGFLAASDEYFANR